MTDIRYKTGMAHLKILFQLPVYDNVTLSMKHRPPQETDSH